MAILKVAQLGHPVLRRVADPIDPEQISGTGIQQLIADMRETMEDYDGVGLAAPQVHYSVRLVILEVDEEQVVLINPIITPTTTDMVRSYEGCLSVWKMRAAVNRYAAVRVEAYGEDGGKLDFIVEDFDAIVMQHECDHLDGVLYIDRCDTRTMAFLDEYRRWGPLDELFEIPEGEE
jgi:peptide deformylase